MAASIGRKKRVSKRNKKSWRKHTDIKDVEDFLEDERLEERLGVKFRDRADNDLFKIDTTPTAEKPKRFQTISEKRKRALEPPKCFQGLQPTTAVPDPISKRNRVKTAEERKGNIHKLIEDRNKQNGIFKKKERDAMKDRAFAKKIKNNIPKRGEFNVDLWSDEKEDILGKASEWLTDDDVRHILTNVGKYKVRHPRTFMRNPAKYHSSLPVTEKPHPGTSYNPSFTDHQELLREVVDREMKLIKEEEHLKRTTTDLFSKVTVDERSNSWLTEMSQGLKSDENVNEEENGGEYTAINPPTSFDKKKPLKKKRKQKEARMAALEKKKLRVEKKKISDIYKLKFFTQELDEKEQKYAKVQEKRKKKKELKGSQTKRLNHNRFEEPDLVFKRGHEITGSLRTLEPEGYILTDRFTSMQRRNILPPSVKQNKTKRAKVKRYIKPGFRIEMET